MTAPKCQACEEELFADLEFELSVDLDTQADGPYRPRVCRHTKKQKAGAKRDD